MNCNMPSKTQINDERLVACFIVSFEKLDGMVADESDPIAMQLAFGTRNKCGLRQWRPAMIESDSKELEPIYAQLPARFPPLFERLVLNFRWAEVDLQTFRLLANPPGPGLGGLLQEMSGDRTIWKQLRQAGYMQFGKGPGGDYDPVCFDTNSRAGNRDYKIVKIAHEQILCNDRIKVTAVLAHSFRELMLDTIARANRG